LTRETSPILHLTYSRHGGAGNIAQLLVQSQQELGYNSQLVAVADQSISSKPLADPVQALAAAVDQFLLAKPGSELFTIFRARISRIADRIEADGAILHLHWLPAAASDALVSELSKRALKTIWTLHDYRPITGGCHYPSHCNGFTSGCHDCPQVRGFARRLITRGLEQKVESLSERSITFVSPSTGLFRAAKHSLAALGHKVELIPNPVSSRTVKVSDPRFIANSTPYIFVATNLEEKRKGLDKVLAWWASARQQGETLLLVGQGSEKFQSDNRGILAAGSMPPEDLANAYRNSRALVFASSEDNAPGVLAEAASHGLPIICLDTQMRTWLGSDGLSTLEIDQVRRLSKSDAKSIVRSYEQFLQARQPQVAAQRYLKLYFS
jgi:glycosyltransferase involved in cell wall biosynthesis